MTEPAGRTQVVIAGGGVAALELLLALRVLAGPRVDITLLTGDAELAPRAMTVGEPFRRGGAQTYDWAQIAEHQHADLVIDRLVAVDCPERVAFTHGGARLRYDVMAVATGARRVGPLAGALTFGTGADAGPALRRILADVRARETAGIAFALPSPSIWPLPLYELALMTGNELREHGRDAPLRIVTPEHDALELFGSAARDAVVPMLDAFAIELVTDAQPREVLAGGLRLASGDVIGAEHVVTLADVVARPVAGLPFDRAGFVPVDVHGRVSGESDVYAAGEATSYPLRQGGLAAQQADAVAAAIAVRCGALTEAEPFSPVLRGRLMTPGSPLYLQARASGQSLASARALWAPPEKVAGRYLAPYLATARPPSVGAAPLSERVPALAGTPPVADDATTLALAIAAAEARCGNSTRALRALEAAHALKPDGRSPVHGRAVNAAGARIPAR